MEKDCSYKLPHVITWEYKVQPNITQTTTKVEAKTTKGHKTHDKVPQKEPHAATRCISSTKYKKRFYLTVHVPQRHDTLRPVVDLYDVVLMFSLSTFQLH